MKYYKSERGVHAFELDGSQDDYITEDMVRMTPEEEDRHVHPEKYLTEQQKYELYLATLTPLTRRQFKLALLENNLLETIETVINSIEDATLRTRIQIEYAEASEFRRTSESIAYMCQLLGLNEQQINFMWEHATTL